jgi:hypothetical protein
MRRIFRIVVFTRCTRFDLTLALMWSPINCDNFTAKCLLKPSSLKYVALRVFENLII